MRHIIIKSAVNSPSVNVDSVGETIRFNYENSFIKLLAVINIISALFVLQWLFFS